MSQMSGLTDFHEQIERLGIQDITGIIHAGAHRCEEVADYTQAFGDIPMWWVEANPDLIPHCYEVLDPYKNQHLIHALVLDKDDAPTMLKVTNTDAMSSSVLELGTHKEFAPDTYYTHVVLGRSRTLDSLVGEHTIEANMLVMDLQGAEALALQGATELLTHLDVVMTEVNRAEVYVGCAKVWELDALLFNYGLVRVDTYWVPDQDWGDACYCRA